MQDTEQYIDGEMLRQIESFIHLRFESITASTSCIFHIITMFSVVCSEKEQKKFSEQEWMFLVIIKALEVVLHRRNCVKLRSSLNIDYK